MKPGDGGPAAGCGRDPAGGCDALWPASPGIRGTAQDSLAQAHGLQGVRNPRCLPFRLDGALRTWLPASRWQPLPFAAVPMPRRPRSCMDHARGAAQLSRSNPELFRSEVRVPRPGQELPGRVCNFPDRTLRTSDLESARPDLASNIPDLKSPGSDRVKNFPVPARNFQIGKQRFPIGPRADPT